MIFGRKRKEQQEEPAPGLAPPPVPRSLYRSGRSQFEPPESGAQHTEVSPEQGADAPESASSADAIVRPRVVFSAVRSGPAGLVAAIPLSGELAGVIPGPDRPDYCLVVLDDPIDFEIPDDFDRERIRQTAIDQMTLDLDDNVSITAVVIAARQTGTQISPTMVDLAVNVAYVLDESVLTDETLEFDRVHFAGIATLNLE